MYYILFFVHFFSFFTYINTSLHQQSHSVTMIVMLGKEEERGEKANAFLETKKLQKNKNYPPTLAKKKVMRRRKRKAGNKN